MNLDKVLFALFFDGSFWCFDIRVQEDAAQVVVLALHQNILPVVLTHDSSLSFYALVWMKKYSMYTLSYPIPHHP